MGKTLRKLILGLAVLACLGAWAGVAVAYLNDVSVAQFTLAVTIAALATEALIWALAFITGWTVFANRKAVWARLTGTRNTKGV